MTVRIEREIHGKDTTIEAETEMEAIDMARGEVSWHPEGIEKPDEVVTDG